MQPQIDISERVGMVIASSGAGVTAFVVGDVVFNEIIRLLSSCIIAALGAIIGYYITKELKRRDAKRAQTVREWEEYWERVEARDKKQDARSKMQEARSKRQDSGNEMERRRAKDIESWIEMERRSNQLDDQL